MSWNGSDQSTPTPRKRTTPPRRTSSPSSTSSTSSSPRSLLRGALAGLIVVALAAAALWYFVLRTPAPRPSTSTSPSTSRHIAETKPALVPTNAAPVAKSVAQEKPKELPPQKVGEVRNGYVLLPSGRLHRRLGIITNNMNSAEFKMPYEVFDFRCDNEIACLLELKPGEMLMGTPRYNGRFKAQFLESLKHPIVISPDDSDYVRRVKEDVRQMKIEMKAAMDRGEDIEQMMLDARQEAQKLATYKRELEKEVDAAIMKGAENAKDVEDCVNAMNKMLEEKGIAPVNVNLITRRKFSQLVKNKGKDQK